MIDEPRPVASIAEMEAYSVPRPPIPVDLYLHGNEGPAPPDELFDQLSALGTDVLRSYPSTSELEAVFANRIGVDASNVFASAGADESIDRLCRAMLENGASIVLPEPTFVMFRHYASLAEGRVVTVPWDQGDYPTEAVIAAIDEDTRLVAMVTPNNPTGAVALEDDLRRVAEAAPHAVVILDHAYVEFTEHDLTPVAMEYENVVVLRTLSKAFGMAGIRVGFAIGPENILEWLRRAGGPYSVPGPSARMAAFRLSGADQRLAAFVDKVVDERRVLEEVLARHGIETTTSEGNFVFGRCSDATWLRDALAGFGILVRAFPGHALLDDAIRISCPGDAEDFERLVHALETILGPDAILFDLDGVFADVSQSYRQSIIDTAAEYGVEVTADDVAKVKAAGDANNDWVVTQRLLAARDVYAELDEVTETFERIYQGTDDEPGLRATESLLVSKEWISQLAERHRIGIVTGRPKSDARRFLEENGLDHLIEALVCMEDAPAKPNPAPVALLKDKLGVERAWLVGDTPDDVRAARGADVLPIGVVAPGDEDSMVVEALTQAGAARVLKSLDQELEELLP